MLLNTKMNSCEKRSKNYKKKMLNSKETLKKLHQALPNLTLDELFTILDCYTEEYSINYKDYELPKMWYTTTTGVERTPCINGEIKNSIDGPYTVKYGGINSESNGNVTARQCDFQLTGHH